MATIIIRPATSADCLSLAAMCHLLWPDASADEHARDVAPILSGRPPGPLPMMFFLAERDAGAVGFIQVGLRSHADGCDPSHPVGFVEGWYVQPEVRRQGIGSRLLKTAERWSGEQGCKEMASDTWIDEVNSQKVHSALGFEEVDRCVHYRKPL